MRRGAIFQTRADALLAIRTINEALGATEIARDETTGIDRVVPRKTWATPVALADGSWFVPWKEKLNAVAGRTVRIDGENRQTLAAAAVVDVDALAFLPDGNQ